MKKYYKPKKPDWTPAEIKLLKKYSHYLRSAAIIKNKLLKKRTAIAIRTKKLELK